MWWRDPRAAIAGEAERALELGAAVASVWRTAGTGSASTLGPHPRERRSGSARSARDPQDAVVGPRLDRPVVEQEGVGDVAQPLQRVVVLVGDRLVGHVAAGHHQRLADVGQQQVMQRAVREHHAELGRQRRDRGGDARAGPPRRQHDRPVAPAQQRRLELADAHELARRLEVARHQRERLVLAVLARPQRRDRPLVGREAREVEPADPLHRHDPTRLQHRHRASKGV